MQQLQAAVLGQVAGAVAMADLSDPTQNPFVGLQALQFLPQMLDLPNAANDGTSADEKFTYTASISHDFSDQLNVYLTYATGYKATSWNLSRDTRPTQGEYDALVSAGVTLPNNLTIGTRLAGPEESEVVELGIKYNAPWGYVNAAFFNQTIEGFQSNVFTGAGFNLANAGEQSVDGVEVDVMLRPTERLSLGVSGTYLDPFYDSFIGANVGGAAEDLSGTKPGGIPELTLSLIGSYDFTILGWDAWVQADYRYDKEVDIQDGGDQSAANILLETTGSRTREVGLLNASVGIARNGWEFRVWGRNLTNDEYLITWFPSVAQTGSFSGYPNQPRMWGASIRKSF
jgi:outer membrane receptor protein involved in Fe transport